MPIYDYECSNCGDLKEYVLSIHTASTIKCPSCGCDTCSKIFQGVQLTKEKLTTGSCKGVTSTAYGGSGAWSSGISEV